MRPEHSALLNDMFQNDVDSTLLINNLLYDVFLSNKEHQSTIKAILFQTTITVFHCVETLIEEIAIINDCDADYLKAIVWPEETPTLPDSEVNDKDFSNITVDCATDNLKSAHQHKVEIFMTRLGIKLPHTPTNILEDDKRLLAAKLLLEETLETIQDGLGIDVVFTPEMMTIDFGDIDFNVTPHFNVNEMIDGCCDVRYVATYILSLCGIPDQPFQEQVDNNNLMKFSGDGHRNEDGKWVKPSDHPSPMVHKIFEAICTSPQ